MANGNTNQIGVLADDGSIERWFSCQQWSLLDKTGWTVVHDNCSNSISELYAPFATQAIGGAYYEATPQIQRKRYVEVIQGNDFNNRAYTITANGGTLDSNDDYLDVRENGKDLLLSDEYTRIGATITLTFDPIPLAKYKIVFWA